ncbi:hypothetical protein B0H14DRAFT_2606967 [Mycena olivaceomarginata]|nr:hypothetical protein B0H14DRAFT_2606967 [Mycena olivaceomarginata]
MCTLLLGLKPWYARTTQFRTRRSIAVTNSVLATSQDDESVEHQRNASWNVDRECASPPRRIWLCLLSPWVVQIIPYLNTILDTPLDCTSAILFGQSHQIAGMYPTLTIVIVNFKRTIWEEHPITVRGFNTLQFAVDTTRSGATRTLDTRPEVDTHPKTASQVVREHPGIPAESEKTGCRGDLRQS